MVKASDIYKMFRNIVAEHYRVPSKNEIHVHEIVQCLRKSYYERKYGSSDFNHLSDTKCVILGLGLITHDALEALFMEYFKADVEVPFELEFRVRDKLFKLVGTVDVALADAIVDLKTVNKIPDRPYDHHYDQVQLYMYLSDAPIAYIVYICKKDGRVKVFQVTRDENRISHLLNRAYDYAIYLIEDKVPPAEPNVLCKYCEYSLKCFSNSVKEVGNK